MDTASASPTRRPFVFIAAGWALPAAAVAVLMMYIAWDHNPQGEFHSDAGVEWAAWLSLGLVWFLGIWLPALVTAVVVRLFVRPSKQSPSGPPAG